MTSCHSRETCPRPDRGTGIHLLRKGVDSRFHGNDSGSVSKRSCNVNPTAAETPANAPFLCQSSFPVLIHQGKQIGNLIDIVINPNPLFVHIVYGPAFPWGIMAPDQYRAL